MELDSFFVFAATKATRRHKYT